MRTLAIIAALLLATPVVAADSSDSAKPAEEKKICKTIEPATGTRMGSRKICRTAADWEANRRMVQQDIELRQRSDYNASETNGLGEPR